MCKELELVERKKWKKWKKAEGQLVGWVFYLITNWLSHRGMLASSIFMKPQMHLPRSKQQTCKIDQQCIGNGSANSRLVTDSPNPHRSVIILTRITSISLPLRLPFSQKVAINPSHSPVNPQTASFPRSSPSRPSLSRIRTLLPEPASLASLGVG